MEQLTMYRFTSEFAERKSVESNMQIKINNNRILNNKIIKLEILPENQKDQA